MQADVSSQQRPRVDQTEDETASAEPAIQTERVDVYLLRPEEPREVEIKDLTIMKPKNNKMHRLLRFFPRCEISYRAVPPPAPEQKLVTSPRGTTTTVVVSAATHRHNGGFSNPGRNAEVFRLKRQLLKEYFASLDAGADPLDPQSVDAVVRGSVPKLHADAASARERSAPQSPTRSRERRQPLPKYQRGPVGDGETAPLTTDRATPLSLDERLAYVSSLWPSLAPTDRDAEIMDYYGIEVEIVSEEERAAQLAQEKEKQKEAAAAAEALQDEVRAVKQEESSEQAATAPATPSASTMSSGAEESSSSPETSELSVETRSAALQKQKEAEGEKLVKATKQDDWVQCDKCQKWRRLPNHVNVSDLPAVWYCKMNRWDKRFNKCSAPEEKVTVLMKESELVEYRRRRFALDFLQRVKRMEKAMAAYKFSDARDDDGARKWVQCVQCLKKRPLLGGMDPRKVGQPFVCWMNWDELHASCSAPQGPLLPRKAGDEGDAATSKAHAGEEGKHLQRKGGSGTSAALPGEAAGKSAPNAGAEAGKKAGKGGPSSNGKKVKRKTPTGDKSASSAGAGGSAAASKKPRRR